MTTTVMATASIHKITVMTDTGHTTGNTGTAGTGMVTTNAITTATPGIIDTTDIRMFDTDTLNLAWSLFFGPDPDSLGNPIVRHTFYVPVCGGQKVSRENALCESFLYPPVARVSLLQ